MAGIEGGFPAGSFDGISSQQPYGQPANAAEFTGLLDAVVIDNMEQLYRNWQIRRRERIIAAGYQIAGLTEEIPRPQTNLAEGDK